MQKETISTKNIKEETKMNKYIVEAPEPLKDQKVSSGGIRNKNGKLASQFKNPVPYHEPAQPPTVVNRSNADMIRKEQAKARRNEAEKYILVIVWQEFEEPLLRSGLRKLGQKVIGILDTPKAPPLHQGPILEAEIIEAEADAVETVCDEDKIIHFPDRKIV